MNFPSVDFSWFGNGNIIALIAIVHVMISHGVAIGMSVLTVTMEYRALKRNNEKLNQLAKKMAKWILIITTTAGAMTGVGIWFSTTVLQPDSIGTLLRVFFWAWVAEWIVFITEVILLIVYYYTWDKCKSVAQRMRHIQIGIALAIFSWLTMAIITGVLAAKLTPGNWLESKSFWDAFINPTYLPSLGFRMFLAVLLAITITSLFVRFFVKDRDLRAEMFNVFAFWSAICLPGVIVTGLWYFYKIPAQTYDMIVWSTGMTPMMFKIINITALVLLVAFTVWMTVKPKSLPWILTVAVFTASLSFIGEFEMVRESIRKPFIIYDYMYANGILAQDQEKLNEEGFLPNATWAKHDTVGEYTTLEEAGRDVFVGQCIVCHTENGWRSSRALGKRVDGWSEDAIVQYVPAMHNVRKAMPPFMGTEEELQALAAYLHSLTNKQSEAALNE